MIRGKFLTSQDDTSAVMDIRRRVFVDEQGYGADTEIDRFDQMAVYALAFDENDRPAGTGRLIINDESRFQIGRVCVLKEARGRGLGDLVVRTDSRRVFVDGEEVELKNKEYELLLFLISNADIVFSKETLYERIWGYDALGDSATVAVHINRLREKIEVDPANPVFILTRRGAGYYFAV